MAAITIDPTIATWQVAVERLDPNLRARLVIAGADTFDTFNILNSVLDQAEQQKNVCLRKRWKVDIQGKQVILRDVFDKITAWVDKFKGVVDVAVQYDTGSASLPWAGIRFLLQCAINEKQCFESTIHGLEAVSSIIARYAIIENLYLQRRFLWVNLQMDRFCKLKSNSSILNALQDRSKAAATSINNLYAEMLDHISASDSVSHKMAMQALSWLMCMHETMAPEALLTALSINQDHTESYITLTELLSICSNLIVLDRELNTLRLAHATVKEFLSSLAEFNISQVNSVAAITCLDACIESLPVDLSEVRPDKDFHLYAAMYWARHYSMTAVNERSNGLIAKLQDFIFCEDDEPSLSFVAWLDVADDVSGHLPNDHPVKKDLNAVKSSTGTALFTACIYGLTEVLGILDVAVGFNIDQVNSLGHTGLYLACANGQDEAVSHQLHAGADLTISCGHHGNALCAACAGGYARVVQLLLSHPGDSLSSHSLKQALEVSLRTGHEEAAQVVLNGGLEVLSRDEYDSLVESASQVGFSRVVQHMDKKFPYFGNPRQSSARVIEAAIGKGLIHCIRKQIPTTSSPDDAIATAAFYGHNEIVSFFIAEGLDIEKEGRFGTPLRVASLMGHDLTVRLLLQRGADVNANGPFGDALKAAAMKGHLSITNTLIQHNANVQSSGGDYGTALQAAAYRGHTQVVNALISAGADISKSGLFRDSFCAAAAGGHYSLIDSFIAKGYRNVRSVKFTPPARRMASRPRRMASRPHDPLRESSPSQKNRSTLTKVLRQHPSPRHLVFDPASSWESIFALARGTPDGDRCRNNTADPVSNRSSALAIAAADGHELIVRKIIEKRGTVGIDSMDIGEALQIASEAGNTDVVNCLLSAADIDKRYIGGSLERAAWHGHIEILDLFIAREDIRGGPPEFYDQYRPDKQPGGSPSGYSPFSKWTNYFYHSTELLPIGESSDNGCLLRALLLGCGGDQVSTVQHVLTVACSYGLRNLREAALQEAARSNSIKIMEFLCRDGEITESTIFANALQEAARNGSLSAFKYLLEHDHGCHIRTENYSRTLKHALEGGHTAIVELVVQKLRESERHDDGHQVQSEDFPELFELAVKRGYTIIVGLLIPEIQRSSPDNTVLNHALHQACASCHIEVAALLLRSGAEVNALVEREFSVVGVRTCPGRTALQTCLRFDSYTYHQDAILDKKREEIVELLLRNGADICVVDAYGCTPLHMAALRCSKDIINTMLQSGGKVDAYDNYGRSPLQCAASRELGSYPIFCALVDAGADIKVATTTEATGSPMLNAALRFFDTPNFTIDTGCEKTGSFTESHCVDEILSTGPGAVIRLLLQSNPELQATDERFGLLLHMVACSGDTHYLQLLIERNVNINANGYWYGSALQAAARYGRLECVKQLLEAGANVNVLLGRRGPPLQAAVKSRNVKIAKRVMDNGVDMRSYDYSPALRSACGRGDLEMVQLLLSKAATISGHCNDPPIFGDLAGALQKACHKGHYHVAHLILKNGADLEKGVAISKMQGQSSLDLAARAGHIDIIHLLIKSGAALYDAQRRLNILKAGLSGKKPKETFRVILPHISSTEDLFAASQECLPSIHIDEGTFLSLTDDLPRTPALLRLACMLGFAQVVKLMLDGGVDIDSIFEDGGRAMHIAAYYQNFELLPYLVSKGADIGFVGPKYGCPVSAALEGLHVSWEKMTKPPVFHSGLRCRKPTPGPLSEKEIDTCEKAMIDFVQAVGFLGSAELTTHGPPLHMASVLGMVRLVALLLKKDADVHFTGGYYGSALIAAVHGKSQPVMDILLDRGTDVNIFSPKFGTALHQACENNDPKSIHLLLSRGADLNAKPSDHESPLAALFRCADNESVDQAVDILLRHDDAFQITEDILRKAIFFEERQRFRKKHPGILKRLLDHDNLYSGNSPGSSSPCINHEIPSGQTKITPALLGSVKSPDHLRLLLRHEPRCAVSHDVFEVIVTEKYIDSSVVELLEVLLEEDPLAILPTFVVEQLLSSYSRTVDPEKLKLLLSRFPADSVDQSLMEHCARQYNNAQRLQTLLDHNNTLQLNHGIIEACNDRGLVDALEVLFRHDSSDEMLKHILLRVLNIKLWRIGISDEYGIVRLLSNIGKKVKFTPQIRKALEGPDAHQQVDGRSLANMVLELEDKDE